MRSSLPEGDSRTGFPPAGLPPLPVPTRVQYHWYFPADYSACVQPITSASLAAYCSTSSARAEFLQRVRWLLTSGPLRPVCALGGNRLASSFQATSIGSFREEITLAGSLEYQVVGRVGPVGQVGQVGQVGRDGWYAGCQSTTIKSASSARAENSAGL